MFFYKATCPVCQLAAPKVERFEKAYPGRIVGVGQDPPDRLDSFGHEFGMDFPSVPDTEPYELSNAYDTRVVPTAFLVDERGNVDRVVESWDREGLNELSRRDFVKTSGALVVCFSATSLMEPFATAQGPFDTHPSHIDPEKLDSWLAVAPDGTVTGDWSPDLDLP